MYRKTLYAFFTCYLLVEVQSDSTVYAMSGYAFPQGVPSGDPLQIIQSLQSTMQSHYSMIPASLRNEAYLRAKQMFDAAAKRATDYVSNSKLSNVPGITDPLPVNTLPGKLPGPQWMDSLPLPLRQLLNTVQFVRKNCPLCQMIERAIRGGSLAPDSYAIDSTGNIFQAKNQDLIPSNLVFDGEGIVDATGATIISIY